jgi:hypothetical protein
MRCLLIALYEYLFRGIIDLDVRTGNILIHDKQKLKRIDDRA